MKTISILITLLITSCTSLTFRGQYADYSIDNNRNITVTPKVISLTSKIVKPL